MRTYSFEKLEVWQLARTLTKNIYRLTSSFPKEERFGLVSQMRRAAISVCSNLAEGTGKHSNREKAHFTRTAYCSLMELLNQCILSHDLQLLTTMNMEELRPMFDEIAGKTSRLRDAQLRQKDV